MHDLVDYVFGVEAGLDTHARKNRSGDATESLLHRILQTNGIPHGTEVYSTEYDELRAVLGTDKKRFDFVVKTQSKTFLIEVNFYNDGGSKLNETARSYKEIASEIKNIKNFTFIWITDGAGWKSAKNNLKETFNSMQHIYNINDLKNNILQKIIK